MQDFDPANPYADNTLIEERQLRGSRRSTAKHLLHSYQNKVHATMFKFLEVGKLRAFGKEIDEGSIVDHFIRAVALCLREKPEFNATYDGKLHKIYEDVNVSYAVSTEKGLVTPVLRNADKLSLGDFYNERKRIISLVLEWKQQIKDILGGTFTITNLGNFGVDWLQPIINPPQVAILGMGRLCKKNITWDLDKSPEEKELMPMSIAFDHRVIDGSDAAEFANLIQEKVNNPKKLWEDI